MQAWVPVEDYYYGYNSITWSLSVEVLFHLSSPLFVPSLLRVPAAARRASIAGCVLFVLVLNASLAPFGCCSSRAPDPPPPGPLTVVRA